MVTYKINEKKENNDRYKLLLSAISLILIFAFIGFAFYSRPPLGDDVLTQFLHCETYYMSDVFILGKQSSNLLDAFAFAISHYWNWGGRLLPYFMFSFTSIFGVPFVAIGAAFIYTSLIISMGSYILNSYRKVMFYPLLLIFNFLVIIYYNSAITYLLMWTFVSIYGVGALLSLNYMYLINKIYKRDQVSVKIIVLMNVLGFLAGITHEMFVFMMFIYLLVLFIKSNNKFLDIKLNIGLFIGACVCVFARGNFIRMGSLHDTSINMPYFYKLHLSVLAHRDVLSVKSKFFFLLFCMIVGICFVLFFSQKQKYKILKTVVSWPLFLALLTSPFSWAFVSYVPQYGLLLFVILFWIFVFKLLLFLYAYDSSNKIVIFISKIYKDLRKFINFTLSFFVVLIVSYLMFRNLPWLSSNFSTRLQWNKLIDNALNEKRQSVSVPRFEEKYSNRFNFYNYCNKKYEYENEYYKRYYKILVIPEK